MTVFFATLKVANGKEGDFERLQTELSKLTHENEPDCLVYDVVRHRDEPNTYAVYARFRDEHAFQHHQTIDFHERLVPPILACLGDEPMDLQFFDHVA